MAALWSRAEELESPAAELGEALAENLSRFPHLSAMPAELRDLTTEARKATDP
jgi:hypothetical protein